MACALTLPSGITFTGNTKDVALEGVLMESMAFCGGACPIGAGDTGVLTLRFKVDGKDDYVKVRCQVAHVSANGAGLTMRYSNLIKKDQDKLGQIIAVGRAQIETG